MENHTRGLKTDRMFCKNKETNEPFEVVAFSDNNVILRNLVDESNHVSIHNAVDWGNEFVGISQGDVFDCIDNDDDEQHARMMQALGIGYICPFCGGRLHWESDFMASEVHGMYNTYVEIDSEAELNMVKEKETEFRNSKVLGVTDDIEKEKSKVDESGYYDFMYMREDKDGKTTYYQIDDSVIGIYRCANCGKYYEIQDCLPSEEKDYPYFS